MKDHDIQRDPESILTAPNNGSRRSVSDNPPQTPNAGSHHAIKQRMTEAEQRAIQLCKLAVELKQDNARDRRDLARVLRDDLQQTLVAAYLWVRMTRTKDTEQALKEALEPVEELISQGLVTLRSLASQLSPQLLYESSFVSALAWLAREAQAMHGMEVSISADPHVEPSTQEVRSVLFRGVKELLFNNVKHTPVRTISITVIRAVDKLRVTVDGRGVGFNPTGSENTADGGFSLILIRECLTYLGGSLELNDTPGHGTRAEFVIPQEPREHKTSMPRLVAKACVAQNSTHHCKE